MYMTRKTKMIRSGSEAELYNHYGRSKYRDLDVLQSQFILYEMGQHGARSRAPSCWRL
jgi:hypothetical protein